MPYNLKQLSVKVYRNFRLISFFIRKLFLKKSFSIPKDIYLEYNKSRKYGPLNKVCYAPYTSMFFSRTGYVSPCYASYNSRSSRVSDSSIKDIWHKGSFKDIRIQHGKGDLQTNCSFCRDLMFQKSFGSLLINKYEHYAFSRKKYPVIMEFELSNRCNLACIMCDSNLSSAIAGTNDNQSDDFYGESFIEQLEEFIPHLQLAEFTGGDPFLIKDYYKIWDVILDKNPSCHLLITTNANTMNDKIESMLDSFKNIHFNISIDSLIRENYEKIRRNGNFEIAMSNINKFIDYSKKNNTFLNLLVCPLTVNRHEFADFVRFANKKDIGVYFHTVIKPKDLSLKYLNKKLLAETITQMKSEDFITEGYKQTQNVQNFVNLIQLLENWMNEDVADIKDEKKHYANNSLFHTNDIETELINKITKTNPNIQNRFVFNNKEIKNKFSEEEYMIFIDYLNKMEFARLVEILENNSIEEIFELSKTLINRLSDVKS